MTGFHDLGAGEDKADKQKTRVNGTLVRVAVMVRSAYRDRDRPIVALERYMSLECNDTSKRLEV